MTQGCALLISLKSIAPFTGHDRCVALGELCVSRQVNDMVKTINVDSIRRAICFAKDLKGIAFDR